VEVAIAKFFDLDFCAGRDLEKAPGAGFRLGGTDGV
jgi:hypothetical protein